MKPKAKAKPASARRTPVRLTPRVRPQRSGPFHAEIVVAGRDLLRGLVRDEDAMIVARTVAERGGLVHRITIVDDSERAIAVAIREALERNPNLLVTIGGLGPAADDHTAAGVAAALGRPLTANPPARNMVEDAYRRLHQAGRVKSAGMNLTREKMSRLPVGALAIPNQPGIAPGMLCRLSGGAAVVSLPGTPEEARAVLSAVLDELGEGLSRFKVAQRTIESPTPDESALRPMIEKLADEHPHVWISSRPDASPRHGRPVRITLEAMAPTAEEANTLVAAATRRLLALAAGSR
jgi:nicotinamide-nucleotide amidase